MKSQDSASQKLQEETMEPKDLSSNSHCNVFVKQLLGVGALIVCFSVMMLFILGIAQVVQGQPTSDSLTYASNAAAERTSGTVRVPIHSGMVWRENFGEQTALSLQMSNARVKELTLQNLIIIATHHGDELDLSDAVPALLRVYEWSSDERFQTMALAALQAIGDEDGMERVLELFGDARFRQQRLSPRLRHMTHAALSEHLQAQGY